MNKDNYLKTLNELKQAKLKLENEYAQSTQKYQIGDKVKVLTSFEGKIISAKFNNDLDVIDFPWTYELELSKNTLDNRKSLIASQKYITGKIEE